MNSIAITLREWESASPETDASLVGAYLGGNPGTGRLIGDMARRGILEVTELRTGIMVQATSFVGRVQIGGLTVTVQPKVTGTPLLNLLRYAYGLRHLDLYDLAEYDAETNAFQDLLILQLAAEVDELISRGVHRRYVRLNELLGSPKGRIDIQRIARNGISSRGELPCRHHPRLADCLPNQLLLAGLRLAIPLASSLELRGKLRRLSAILDDDVSRIRLDRFAFVQLHRELDRLLHAYVPSIRLVGLLLESAGISLEEDISGLRLPGFLFNMNHFFQALLFRFLSANLAGFRVEEEQRIQNMMAYIPGYNPRKRQDPTPRPDYVVLQNGSIAAILDAKYRDLWEHSLPRDMLYQLAMYALSQGRGGKAAMLFPTTDADASESRIAIRDPVRGRQQTEVILRPVNLLELEKLVSGSVTIDDTRRRHQFAHRMAFGERDKQLEPVGIASCH